MAAARIPARMPSASPASMKGQRLVVDFFGRVAGSRSLRLAAGVPAASLALASVNRALKAVVVFCARIGSG